MNTDNSFIFHDSRPPGKVLHPSTECVLEALQELRNTHLFHTILDIGCGSGVLSMIAAHFWPESRIIASDISQAAIADAQRNIEANTLTNITLCCAPGCSHPDVQAAALYDLILANVLPEALVEMAADIARICAPGGVVVLSGILAWKLDGVRAAYEAAGLTFVREIKAEDWRGLLFFHD